MAPQLARTALASQSASDPLVLLTLTHPQLANLEVDHPDLGLSGGALRLVNAGVDIVSRAQTYLAFPFAFTPPPEGERGRPTARLTISNVDRRIIQIIRLIVGAPQCTLEIVYPDAPDVVERTYPAFLMTSLDADAVKVTGTVSTRHDDDEPVNASRHTPKHSPGLF